MERDFGDKGYVDPLRAMNLSSKGYFSLVDGQNKGVMEVISKVRRQKVAHTVGKQQW